MSFNPKVERQAQAKTDYNKASDIIREADRKYNGNHGTRQMCGTCHQGPWRQPRGPWLEVGRGGDLRLMQWV